MWSLYNLYIPIKSVIGTHTHTHIYKFSIFLNIFRAEIHTINMYGS